MSKVNLAHSFVYAFQDANYEYDFKNEFILENNKIVLVPALSNIKALDDGYIKKQPNLYFYDVSTGESKEITIEEANKLELVGGQTSPDGYEIAYNNYSDFTGFSSGRSSRFLISDSKASKKIDLKDDGNYYRAPFIVGWVK